MKPLIRTLSLGLLLVFGLSLAACASADCAAIVNGETITKDEVNEELETIKAEYPQMFEGADGESREMDFYDRILDNKITDLLLKQAAEEEGIDVSDEDVDDAIEEIKAGFPDEETFAASLEEVGMTEDDLREQTHSQLLTQAVIESVSGDIEVTDEEIEEYYEANEGQFTQAAAKRASHILFSPEDKETAEEVLAEVNDGGDFAALAKQYSQDPASAENGGDLGWPSTPYVPEFEAALSGLEVGQVSGIVETTYGWHIITVTEVRAESTKTLEEASEEISLILEQQKQAEAFQAYVDELKADAEIEYCE